jgi:hypothetical protein
MVEKKDIEYVILAIGIVLVIVLVVKPMATGEPVTFWQSEPEPTPTLPQPTTTYSPPYLQATRTLTPTPAPTWDGKPKALQFVDPETYHISFEKTELNLTVPPSETMPDNTWVTYATIDGQWSGTTGIITVPFPYWRLDYSEITPLNENFPKFNVQVMDADDPNRFVRIITLNYMDFRSMMDQPDLRAEQWVSTFYEGHRDYYFVINTLCITSYSLKIQIPQKYMTG